MPDYIPDSDADFDLWRSSFDKYLKDNLASLGLVAGDIATLNALQTAWGSTFGDYLSKRAQVDAALQAKTNSRLELEEAIRALVRQLQADPNTTNEQRAGLGVTVPDTTRTRVSIPTSIPTGQIDTSLPLQHSVDFRDALTPNRKAKPEGCKGCQVWYFIGEQPPVSIDDYKYAATDTSTPYVLHFGLEDAGKTVHYRLRWVNTRDEPGPWSEPITATITG
ncbi:MAG: hypothetical protein QOF02_1429 [Blastocatellia bacterium]|jgi:hypothetical protein|nr:hypothetical protein [Blastocatellia bacterium]